jgi:DNA-binding response OmpR family regulator
MATTALSRQSRMPFRTVASDPSVRSAVLAGMDRSVPGLIAGLEAEAVHTWSAEDASEAVLLAARVGPELVLLGDQLDADLSRLLPALRISAPNARILYLISEVDHRKATALVETGVDDVLAPPHNAGGILMRALIGPMLLERAASGGTVLRGSRIVVDRFSRTVLGSDRPNALTAREFDLLERLLQAQGRVVSRETLLADIWGEEQDNEAVLDATVHRLRRKLEQDHSSPRLLVTIRGVGYRLEASRVAITSN